MVRYKPRNKPEGHCPQNGALFPKRDIVLKKGHCPQNEINKEILYKYLEFRNGIDSVTRTRLAKDVQ